jgi:hypothetical protein
MYKYERQYTQQGVLSRPYGKNLRRKWFKAARRDMNVSPKSDFHCCEDHSKLTINYLGTHVTTNLGNLFIVDTYRNITLSLLIY